MAAVERAREAVREQFELSAALRESFLRQIFESSNVTRWPQVRIGDFAKTCSGATPPRDMPELYGGEIPWVKTGELHDSFIIKSAENVTQAALEVASLPLLPPSTLLVAMYGQGKTRGRTGILGMTATTNQACFAILPNEKVLDSKYLQFWFMHNYRRLREETEFRGGNQPNLNGIFLRQQQVPLPAIQIQQKVSEFLAQKLAAVECARETIREQAEAINALPGSLLRQAFAGEL